MQFKLKPKKKNGDTDLWFAWYPVYCEVDRTIVWLEKVTRVYFSDSVVGYVYCVYNLKL